MIQQVEEALVGALEAQCPGYAVDRARSLQDYQFAHPDAALVPVLADEEWGPGPTAANVFRPALPTFAVHSFTHGLYAEPGAYEVLGQVKMAVEGLPIEETGDHPAGTMRIQRRMFERAKPGGVTIYVTTVQLSRD